MQVSIAIHPDTRAWERLSSSLRLLLLLDTFSIAAPGVAVGWQLLLARAFQVHLNRFEPPVLALSVWSLYAADHVFDAFRSRSGWEPARRTFFRDHWAAMGLLAIAGGASALGLALRQLSAQMLQGGVALGSFVLAYLVLVHSGPASWRSRWPREAAVAAGFVSGTFLPVAISGRLSFGAVLPAALLFFCLCWLNCCVVETWECQRSGSGLEQTPHTSTRWVVRHSASAAGILCAAFLLLHGSSRHEREFATAGMASGAVLLLIARFRENFPLCSISLAADLALWTPLIVLARF